MRTKMEMAARSGSGVKWVLLALLVLFSGVGHSKKKQKVEIITESKPDDCTQGAEIGDKLTVHYTGAFTNGKIFDSSRQRDPFTIQLGAKQVIPGWEEGLIGMCEGEVRSLKIPPHLAYGDQGVEGVIPGGATLMFSVELLELKKPSMFSFNRDNLTFIGVVLMVGVVIYEIYRKLTKENEDIKKQKKETKKGNKKKR